MVGAVQSTLRIDDDDDDDDDDGNTRRCFQ